MKLKLGQKAKDKVSGFTGIITTVSEYLNGCRRICLSPDKLTKEGEIIPDTFFDEPQLELIGEGLKQGETKTGGPRTDIPSREA